MFPLHIISFVRLAYLREVEDPYGTRVFSPDPSYRNDRYILSASLADVQLAMSISPESRLEQERPIDFLFRVNTLMGTTVDQVLLAFVYIENEHLSRNVFRVHHDNSTGIIRLTRHLYNLRKL